MPATCNTAELVNDTFSLPTPDTESATLDQEVSTGAPKHSRLKRIRARLATIRDYHPDGLTSQKKLPHQLEQSAKEREKNTKSKMATLA